MQVGSQVRSSQDREGLQNEAHSAESGGRIWRCAVNSPAGSAGPRDFITESPSDCINEKAIGLK